MTAYAMCGDRERFIMAGMNDYISKPFDRNHLAQVLSGIDLKTGNAPDGSACQVVPSLLH